jgi:hypothetical protein
VLFGFSSTVHLPKRRLAQSSGQSPHLTIKPHIFTSFMLAETHILSRPSRSLLPTLDLESISRQISASITADYIGYTISAAPIKPYINYGRSGRTCV